MVLVLLAVSACSSAPAPAGAVPPSRSPAPSAVATPVVRIYRGPNLGDETTSLALPGQQPVSGALCGPHYGLKLLRSGETAAFDPARFPTLRLVYPANLGDATFTAQGAAPGSAPGSAPGAVPGSASAGAAPGGSLVAQLDKGCGRFSDVVTDLGIALKLGDRTVTLATPPDNYDILVVTAPASTPVVLTVTDSGRTASLDLRTGATTGAPTGFDPVRTDWQVLAGKDSDGDLIGGGIECTVVPYSDDAGWAPPGRAWLLVSGKVEVPVNPYAEVPINAAQALSVTGPGGKKIPVTGDLTVGGSHQSVVETDATAVNVPATGKITVRYSFKPSGIGWQGQSGGSITI